MKLPLLTLYVAMLALAGTTAYATPHAVQGDFYNGVNQAWVYYGDDFGNHQGVASAPGYQKTIDGIKASGGNSMRAWVHCTCANTPQFDHTGAVVATDAGHTMVGDLQRLVRMAAASGVKVFFSLFNGALTSPQMQGLIEVDSKMESYVTNALIPIVQGLAGEEGLGGYEIMNEMEGNVMAGQATSNQCTDTRKLGGTGAGWAGGNIPMYRLQRFIGTLAAAVHEHDPAALVTSGAWSEHSITNAFAGQYYNYYADECLQGASGKGKGHLDLYEVHTYGHPTYGEYAPFKVDYKSYNLTRPLIVGEFSQCSNDGTMTSAQQYVYALEHGYAGAWGWQANGSGGGSDQFSTLESGMRAAANAGARD